MKKPTDEEKRNQQIFKHSRCNGCRYAELSWQGYGNAVWFYCQLDLTQANKPLFFTTKCERRYD